MAMTTVRVDGFVKFLERLLRKSSGFGVSLLLTIIEHGMNTTEYPVAGRTHSDHDGHVW
jgi:hypothetical protein